MLKSIYLPPKTIGKTSEILYLKSDSNYCYICFEESSILVSSTLKKVCSKLNQKHFFRIHHSFVINCFLIDRLDFKDLQVIMVDGSIIPIARRRKSSFKGFLSSISSLVTYAL